MDYRPSLASYVRLKALEGLGRRKGEPAGLRPATPRLESGLRPPCRVCPSFGRAPRSRAGELLPWCTAAPSSHFSLEAVPRPSRGSRSDPSFWPQTPSLSTQHSGPQPRRSQPALSVPGRPPPRSRGRKCLLNLTDPVGLHTSLLPVSYLTHPGPAAACAQVGLCCPGPRDYFPAALRSGLALLSLSPKLAGSLVGSLDAPGTHAFLARDQGLELSTAVVWGQPVSACGPGRVPAPASKKASTPCVAGDEQACVSLKGWGRHCFAAQRD